VDKLWAALFWPGRAAWGAALLLLCVYAWLAWKCRAGLLVWRPRRPTWAQLIGLWVTPCLLEEVVWRIAWLPPPPCRLAEVLVSAGLFVLWHPLQARLWRPQARAVFENRNFLLLTLAMALGNSLHYSAFGSLWPLVMVHWIAVCVWIFVLGGWARLGLES